MAHILITGGAGFIGSHTADLLIAKGHRVRILDLLDPQVHGQGAGFPSYLHPAIECLRGDVRRADDIAGALQGIDVVYHFASLTGVGQSMYDMASYMDTNVTGTAMLIETIAKHQFPIQKLILSSSRAVYGEGEQNCAACGTVHPDIRRREDLERGDFEAHCPHCNGPLKARPTRESTAHKPVSIYGLTKQYQEDLFVYAAHTFRIPTVILRYFNVYGSRQSLSNPYTGIVSIFYSRIMAGQPISIYERGKPLRDFVHVSDVARANLLAMERPVPPATAINVGTGAATTIQQVAETLQQAVGRSVTLEETDQFRFGDIHSCYADNAQAKSVLGYEASMSLSQGMQEFANWAQGQQSEDLYGRALSELQKHGLFGNAKRA